MGIETALLGVGLASQLYQGFKGNKAQAKNEKAAAKQYGATNEEINKQLTALGAPGAGEVGLQQYLDSLSESGGIGGTPTFNSAQDALMQMVNRTAAQQLGSAGGYLDELAQTGGAQDVGKLLEALTAQQGYATNEQAARLNASTSGLGQLAGTASRIGEARLRGSMQRDNNVILAGIQQQAMENAMNRRLSAAGTLGGLNLGAGQLNLGAAQGLQGLAGLLLQNQNQALQGYGMLGQLGLGRAGQQNALISLLAGNKPTPTSLTSPLAGAVGQSAEDALLLPLILKRLKTPPTTSTG
jgi:hypothetical protein